MAMVQAIEKCQIRTGFNDTQEHHHLGRMGTYGEQSIASGLVSLHFVNVTDHYPWLRLFEV
ncbi:MAG: hypothetical protein Ct9H300mP21_10240 [Pseudomonadota bacterium]|nr:MAG: hypothetical protein Ct9H300mP21_10240 [Pseudomonadota bacterium]